MDTSVTQPPSQYPSQESLENIDDQVPEGFCGHQEQQTELPHLQLDPIAHRTAKDASRWANQPETPSSGNIGLLIEYFYG